MKTAMLRGAAALLLASASPIALAEESLCSAPGLTILTDNTGDVDATGLSPAAIPLALADIVSVQMALDDSGDAPLLTFTIKLNGSLSALPPNFAWYTSFKSPSNTFYGVRMVTDVTTLESFQSYTLGESTGEIADGRFVAETKEATGSYAGDTITITVPTADLGISRLENAIVSQFNAGSVLEVGAPGLGGLAAVVLDGAPDDLGRRGSVTLAACAPPAESKSGAVSSQFGGALGAALLLPLLALAGRRRRHTR